MDANDKAELRHKIRNQSSLVGRIKTDPITAEEWEYLLKTFDYYELSRELLDSEGFDIDKVASKAAKLKEGDKIMLELVSVNDGLMKQNEELLKERNAFKKAIEVLVNSRKGGPYKEDWKEVESILEPFKPNNK